MSSSIAKTIPQSPVNISTNNTPTQNLDAVLETNYQSSPMEILNNGENIDGEFTTTENYVTYNGEKYYLKGFHFHTSSEHTFNGQNADGEIHLVHKSDSGKILVAGVLLDGVDPSSPEGNLINPQLDLVLGKLDSSLQDRTSTIEGVNFDPNQILSSDAQVYNFGGSLTTEPFSNATWIVVANTLKVNSNTLENFSNLQNDFYNNGGFNNRDIQNELFLGTETADFLNGDRNGSNGFSNDLIYAKDGNDTIDGGFGNDKLYGEIGEDVIFGGSGDDLLVGDNDVAGVNLYSFTEDYLIGGGGEDIIYISGDDFAVGGGANSVDNDLVDLLNEEAFEAEFSFSDQQQDTIVFVNN